MKLELSMNRQADGRWHMDFSLYGLTFTDASVLMEILSMFTENHDHEV